MDYSAAAKQALLDPRAVQVALCGALIFAPVYVFLLRPICQQACAAFGKRASTRASRGGCCGGCCGCLAAILRPFWAAFYGLFLITASIALFVCDTVIGAVKAACGAVQDVQSWRAQRHARIIRERVQWSKEDAAKVAKKYGPLYAELAAEDEEREFSSEEELEVEAVVLEVTASAPRASLSPRLSAGRRGSAPRTDDFLLDPEDDGLPRQSGTTHHGDVTLAEELEEALDDDVEEQRRQEGRVSAGLEVHGTKAVLHPAAAARLRRRDAPARWVQTLTKKGYGAGRDMASRTRTPVLSLENHVRGLFTQFHRQKLYRDTDITEASLEQLYGRPAFQAWYAASREDLLEEVNLRRHFVLWRSVLALVLVLIALAALPAYSFTNKAKVTLLSPVPAGVSPSAATFSQLLVTRLMYLKTATVATRVPAWCIQRCPATAALLGAAMISAEMLVVVAAVLACITAAFMPRRAQATATMGLMALAVIAIEAALATEAVRLQLGMGFLVGFALVAASIAKVMN